jgi:4-hydroxythreonine-4-phosphate dehydrogenase
MIRVAICIGDLNGIGIELALRNHESIKAWIDPYYMIDEAMLQQACKKLHLPPPTNFHTLNSPLAPSFEIQAGRISSHSGAYSHASFAKAIELAKTKEVDAIMTLPIHKKAWELAGIGYKGHTDMLRDIFEQNAIMMLGCPTMYVALFTEHIPLQQVAKKIQKEPLREFLITLYEEVLPSSTIAVLGLNPHAGDGGVLGEEETTIEEAIEEATNELKRRDPTRKNKQLFSSPLVPDVAFTPSQRQRYQYYVAMYHDQGLAPLKALYFDEGINISLNLPILRTSVDHGTAFDIAYSNTPPNPQSYLNAITYIKDRLSS